MHIDKGFQISILFKDMQQASACKGSSGSGVSVQKIYAALVAATAVARMWKLKDTHAQAGLPLREETVYVAFQVSIKH
eukprot:1142574-Pelagomonas_calceolata.AAC.5